MTTEEAIERIKSRSNKWALDNGDLTALQVLGLVDAESKDERMRKAALEGIEYLERKLGWDAIGDTDILDVKEYLERQKEQPMSAEEVLIRAGLKPYRDGNQWCVLAGGNIQEGICGFGDTIDEALYQFLMEVLKIQKKKQPAEWSEDDEEIREEVIGDLCALKDWIVKYDVNWLANPVLKSIDKRISWLKALHSDSYKNCNSRWKPSDEHPEGGCSEKPNDLLSEAAKDSWAVYEYRESPRGLYSTCYVDGFKAGAEWMTGQFQKIEGGLVDWYSTSDGKEYCCGIKADEAFEIPEGFYIRKKQQLSER